MKLSLSRTRLTYANVTASLALFLALGGGAYAAASLPANSVGHLQLRKGAVERSNIKNRAVDGLKVLDNSLTGSDVAESTLGKVPSAANADNSTRAETATNSTHAGSSAALDSAGYRFVTATAPANTASTGASATCAAGQHVVGGGVKVDAPAFMLIDDGYPDAANTAWTAHVANGDDASHDFTVYAICLTVTTTG